MSGRKHKNADCLYRLPPVPSPSAKNDLDECLPPITDAFESLDTLRLKQREDTLLQPLFVVIAIGSSDAANFTVLDGMLCKTKFHFAGVHWLTVIPRSLKLNVLHAISR